MRPRSYSCASLPPQSAEAHSRMCSSSFVLPVLYTQQCPFAAACPSQVVHQSAPVRGKPLVSPSPTLSLGSSHSPCGEKRTLPSYLPTFVLLLTVSLGPRLSARAVPPF